MVFSRLPQLCSAHWMKMFPPTIACIYNNFHKLKPRVGEREGGGERERDKGRVVSKIKGVVPDSINCTLKYLHALTCPNQV